jgi:hypothetical protein
MNTEVSGAEHAPDELPAERAVHIEEAELVPRKIKRVRVQLDARIELTDEELKVHRFCHRTY